MSADKGYNMEKMNIDPEKIRITIPRNKSIIILISSVVFYLAAVLLWSQQELDSAFVIKQNFIFSNQFYLQTAKFISKYGMGIISLSLILFLPGKKKYIYTLLILVSIKTVGLLKANVTIEEAVLWPICGKVCNISIESGRTPLYSVITFLAIFFNATALRL